MLTVTELVIRARFTYERRGKNPCQPLPRPTNELLVMVPFAGKARAVPIKATSTKAKGCREIIMIMTSARGVCVSLKE